MHFPAIRLALIPLALCLPQGTAHAQTAIERVATENPGSVNAYILDAGSGVALVDTHRGLSQGRALAERLAGTGKAVVGILITHPHPDHIGGLAAVEEVTQAPIYGSANTAVEIGADIRKLIAIAHTGDPDDTSVAPPGPSVIVADGETVRIGDLDVTVKEFGPSEASNMTVYAVEALGAVFTGDLVNPGMTPFLLEKRTGDWLEQLDALAAEFPPETMAYPGHGTPGPLGLLVEEQKKYLTEFRAHVQAALADGLVSEAEAADIAAKTDAAFPDHPPVAALPELMKRNILAVAEELSGDPGAPPLATVEP